MLRSLNSGVTGIINHQTRMDVIGNNIANVNTSGFKSSRVTFSEGFSQMMKGASRSSKNAGGTNPMQVGLGVDVSSIDKLMGQGNLQNTGNILDIGIQGNAFFGVSDGVGTYYTRNGGFTMDSNGFIVLPTNGMALQGKMADAFGNFPTGTVIGNLQIPVHQQAPAKATTEVALARNLDADSDAKGSVTYTQQMFHAADSTRGIGANSATDPGKQVATLLTQLYDAHGNWLHMKENDVITMKAFTFEPQPDGTSTHDVNFSFKITNDPPTAAYQLPAAAPLSKDVVYEIRTVDDLVSAMRLFFNSATTGVTNPVAAGATVALGADGVISVNNINGGAVGANFFNFQIDSTNPDSNSPLKESFSFGSPLGREITGTNYGNNGGDPALPASTSGMLLRPAEAFDYMSELYDSTGVAFNLTNGDKIDVSGSIGQNSIMESKSGELVFYDGTPPIPTGATVQTTLNDLIAKIRNDFKLPYEYIDRDGLPYPSVGLKANGKGEDGIPDGALIVRGIKGADFALNSLRIFAEGSSSSTTSTFNAVMQVTPKVEARDVGHWDTSMTIYDDTGEEHNLTITFVHTGRVGEWEWHANFAGKEIIEPGTGDGKITFGQDGTVASFTYNGGGSQLMVHPATGASQMRIKLDVGGPGNDKGLVQFASDFTAGAQKQDGYGTGNLLSFSIDEAGLIEGKYSNGTAKAIAQIMVVDFSNPSGLDSLTDSIFTLSANSGDPVWGKPKDQSSSKLKPGSLEMSNVDLAHEFTTMITTQRGYQANSRIVTVSDTMMEELVNLKR